MLRMSKLADYAFVILSHMARKEAAIWAASLLSEETSLPLPTVAKLMKLLSKGNIVNAQRGAMGGYTLAQPAREMTIAMIIEAVDGPISLTQCAGEAKGDPCNCAVPDSCPVRERWKHVNKAIRGSLESVFLADLMPRPASLIEEKVF